MWRANLQGANLTNANLGLAEFNRANLEGVTLTGAQLALVDFSETVLEESEFDPDRGK
jgi:uncharacterized protein YjbI with pentapeptide repeats